MLDWLFTARRAKGDINAARRGPKALAQRGVTRGARRGVTRLIGRLFR